ncbi:MAG: tryptophan synthase subunit alpha [Myxococcota bacterium]
MDGLLVVDVPPEESAQMRESARHLGLDWVSLVAPTTGVVRARQIAAGASGFIYLVSMTGVTGGRLANVEALGPMVAAIRQQSPLPICIGFGVRDRESACAASRVADGVVVGSVLVAALEAGQNDGSGPKRVYELVKQLRGGVDEAMMGGSA